MADDDDRTDDAGEDESSGDDGKINDPLTNSDADPPRNEWGEGPDN